MSNRERLEKRNKILSKLPDHEDLFKTGEKIQKGYWSLSQYSSEIDKLAKSNWILHTTIL
jgi:hypothetical protein